MVSELGTGTNQEHRLPGHPHPASELGRDASAVSATGLRDTVSEARAASEENPVSLIFLVP